LKEQLPDHDSSGQSDEKARTKRLLCGALLVLAMTITVPGVIATCHDLPKYYHHDGWFFLWLCVFLLIWVRLFHVADRQFGRFWLFRWVKWMGRHVTLLYVVQWLIIGNTATAIYRTQDVASCVLWGALILWIVNLLAWIWTVVLRPRWAWPTGT
jgi:hypothetical protein